MRNPTLFKCILCFYIAFVVCSVVPAILPNIFIRVLPIATLLFCLISYPEKLIRNKSFMWSLVYAFVLFVAATDHKINGFGYGLGEYDTVLVDIGFILPSICISAILIDEDIRKSSLRIVDILIYTSLIISLCYIIPVLLFDPAIARQISYLNTESLEDDLVQFKFGFWDYAMCHMVALTFPLFTGLFINSANWKPKVFYGVMALLVLFFVLNISITTTFIYLLIAALLIIYHRFGQYKVLGMTAILCIGGLCFLYSESIISYLAETYRGTPMEPKIADFQDILAGGTGEHETIDSRQDYHQGAFEGFLNNVLLGSTYYGTGGHSVLLNRLGALGLLGFIPFCLMIYFQFKQWFKIIPSSSKFYYIVSWIGVVILLYSKSLFASAGSISISLIIPSLAMNFISKKSILFPKSK